MGLCHFGSGTIDPGVSTFRIRTTRLINICFYTALVEYTDRGVSDKEDFLKRTFAARINVHVMFSNRKVKAEVAVEAFLKYNPSSSSLAVARVHSSI